jgi:hypothetical protein
MPPPREKVGDLGLSVAALLGNYPTNQNIMDLTYKVRGADGSEYGPASLTEINTWFGEGRVNAQSEVTRSDIDYWAPAANFSELGVPGAVTSAPTPAPVARPVQTSARPGTAHPAVAATAAGADPATEGQLKGGASWFYWIAGLSLINSIAALTGSGWRFILGLGITQMIDAFGRSLGSGGKIVVLILDVLAAGAFVLFGVFAHKRHTWAFIVGMMLFALDGVIVLMAQDWLDLAFHAFVLFCLFRGFQACLELNRR